MAIFSDNRKAHDEILTATTEFVDRLAAQISARATATAPRDTGDLARSIEWRHVAPGEAEVKVGSDHWAPVEYGHRLVAWGNDTGKSVAARPFMRTALFSAKAGF